LAGCLEELPDPPDLGSMMAADHDVFLENWLGPLGFSHRGDFIGEGTASGADQGTLTTGGRGQGLGRSPWWWGWPLAPLRVIFGLRKTSVKIGGSAFVSSNSENISCVTFLKHKNSKK
jgi:hypothetical protein